MYYIYIYFSLSYDIIHVMYSFSVLVWHSNVQSLKSEHNLSLYMYKVCSWSWDTIYLTIVMTEFNVMNFAPRHSLAAYTCIRSLWDSWIIRVSERLD